ncbi:putative phage tail tape measure protein [Paenibacillus larvae subsp. larvae]|uniref:Putative phage tail tape measure protein n=1 Tax=Paenibacillus larvae subsp. larvae TaxID=147375 RepID=A0A2L1UAB3_9BACL|nr:phage tail tape measure protein [Paenibacillus larvae]AQT85697.1 phage tail tape measure protein [Paenibacillus larvae subsp. pulvifaciens]AVF25099.1 putative phage tail tape measure protein [Paenibacillus larvae subsp. larvae]AVF29863.1 putative phage tail tape measure protein [Paenibacillus larvae subsp. larvae]MCY7520672.1 phage tail tape measure protein [Paenibacillus larvae]MCY9500199.1 phage tail tape measure protein [Paenibacillus larvae]
MALIVKIGADIRSFDKEMKKLTKDTETIGKKFTGVGKALTAGLTVPIVALGAASVKMGMDFEAGMSTVKAITGATGKDFSDLQETAKELGATTVFSATEAAEGMKYLGLAGWKTQDIIKAMPGMLDLAAAGALDLGTAADITSDTMQAFGMSADRATHAADVFAYASSNSNTTVEMLGEGMKYLAPVANQFGWSLEESSAAMMFLADAGLKGSIAGQAFASSLTRLAKPTSEMQKVMDRTGISFFDAQGKMKSMPELIAAIEEGTKGMTDQQKSATLSTLFGAEAYKHWAILLGRGSDQLQTMTTNLEQSDGTAKQMSDTMTQNLQGSVKEMASTFESVALIIYDQLKPALEAIVKKITEVLKWFQGLSPEMQKTISIIAAVAAAIGPLLLILGTATKVMGVMKAGLALLSRSFLGLLGPVGLIIAAIAGVIAIIMNWDSIKEFFINLWNSIVSYLSEAWESIKSACSAAWQSISDTTSEVWNAIKDFLVGIWNSIVDTCLAAWQSISDTTSAVWNAIKDFLVGIWNGIVEFVTPIFETIGSIIQGVWDVISTVTSAVWGYITQYLQAIWNAIMYFATPVFQAIGDFIGSVWNTIKEVSSTVWNAISSFLMGIWNGIVSFATPIFQTVGDFIGAVWNTIKQVSSTVWNAITGFLVNIWNGISSNMTYYFNLFKSVVSVVWEAIKSTSNSIWNGIKSVLEGIWNGIKVAAQVVWNGLKIVIIEPVKAISEKVTSIFSAMKEVIMGVWEGIKSGIKSVLNGIIWVINKFIDGVNIPAELLNSIPGVDAPIIPHIPMLAKGGNVFGSGAAIVGEAGPELIEKSGSSVKVTPLSAGEKARGVSGAGYTANINIYTDSTSPAEMARKIRRSQQRQGLEWGLIT